MDKVTRETLKHDKFVESVGHSLEYVQGHRSQVKTYALGALAAVVLIGGGLFWYRSSAAARAADLAKALSTKDGVIGASPSPTDPRPTFATKEAKDTAVKKAFQEVASKHGSSREGAIAHYELGAIAAEAGKVEDAEKHFQQALNAASGEFASLAKLALANAKRGLGKNADAEKLLRELVASPTILVSKEQATAELARTIAKAKPEEAKKLLENWAKDSRPVIARYGEQLTYEVSPK